MKIFISYSSKNQDILKSFVDRILKLGLNISPNDINCTGIESSKPKTGEDFKLWIKENIKSADIIIQLISIDYKASEVCLNEMGASWISNAKVYPLLVGEVNFDNIGFVHNSNQLLRLDSKVDIDKFVDDISEFLKIKDIKTERLNVEIEAFLKETSFKSLSSKSRILTGKRKSINGDFDFFKRFLDPDTNVNALFEKSQPNLYDCKQIFKKEFAKQYYDYYSNFYSDMGESYDLEVYDSFQVRKADVKQLKENEHELPGGMTSIAKRNVFRENMIFYSISFIQTGEEYGVSFSVWCFINERWIFIPKPWRI